MVVKKYPIGTKVIFTAKPSYDRIVREDSGKTATVTGHTDYSVKIFIPNSENSCYTKGRTPPVTWTVPFDDIKLLPQKNEQLLFDFAYEE